MSARRNTWLWRAGGVLILAGLARRIPWIGWVLIVAVLGLVVLNWIKMRYFDDEGEG